ncbi:MAG TPA: putative toxin-antitoxin system toxin component, PIN family [Oxalicibacterium sp.]|nr:putative toxin-antitoxin system toxin component, PIN family [Oxalicibacterium sp.]
MIPKRVVLDTNVCLDLFVFRDPRWTMLLDALQSGRLEAVTREDCRKEWHLVLRYPHLKLDDDRRTATMAEFDALIHCHPIPQQTKEKAEEAVRLPLCKDKDDQKFLELARDIRADVLITKDKALLKLARKTRRDGLFAIMTPEAWTQEASTPSVATLQATTG